MGAAASDSGSARCCPSRQLRELRMPVLSVERSRKYRLVYAHPLFHGLAEVRPDLLAGLAPESDECAVVVRQKRVILVVERLESLADNGLCASASASRR